jgi:hypothetical protein
MCKWIGVNKLRAVAERHGWIVIVAVMLLTLPIIVLSFIGLIIAAGITWRW